MHQLDSKPNLSLLSTQSCSLCEQALDMLLSMPELAGYSLQVIDVIDNDDLLHTYGEKLPVVLCGEQSLAWPFDKASLVQWLNSLSDR